MDTFEVIGAFVDRERVDPELLKHALSTDEGRAYLVDLVALREVTGDQPPPRDTAVRHDRNRSWKPVALAAAIVISATGGYLAGHGTQNAVPAASISVVTDRPTPAETIPPAPVPTTVIQLRPGVDWNESAGG